jgi:hypothetical protein
VKRLWLTLLIGAAALTLGGPIAAAPAGPQDQATASAGIVSIPAEQRLKARSKLRVPIRCTVICEVVTTFTLRLPGPNIGPRSLPGTLDPAAPQDLVIDLNDAATRTLKDSIGVSKLKVKARATDPATGVVNFARKTLRFKQP